jgi:hypothetical protein
MIEVTAAPLLREPSLRTPKSLNWTLGGLGSSLRSGFAISDFSPQRCTDTWATMHSLEKGIQSIADEFAL